MNFKEQAEALKARFTSKINADTSQEELNEFTSINEEIDKLESSYNELLNENAKFKDTIIRMVTNQGSSEKPQEIIEESKPLTMEEIIAQKLNKKEA